MTQTRSLVTTTSPVPLMAIPEQPDTAWSVLCEVDTYNGVDYEYWFNETSGVPWFRFLTPSGNIDVTVHFTALLDAAYQHMRNHQETTP